MGRHGPVSGYHVEGVGQVYCFQSMDSGLSLPSPLLLLQAYFLLRDKSVKTEISLQNYRNLVREGLIFLVIDKQELDRWEGGM